MAVAEVDLNKGQDTRFSGEEKFGKYLDLHELYNMFINSKFGYRTPYVYYVWDFSDLDNIPSKYKTTREYRDYIGALLEYLESFAYRVEAEHMMSLSKDLGSQERSRKRPRPTGDVIEELKLKLKLDGCDTVESVMELMGPVEIKEALDSLGLKSGGTLQQRAERLFLVKNTPLHQLHPRLFKKQINPETALMEAKVIELSHLLQETRSRTIHRAMKKSGMPTRFVSVEEVLGFNGAKEGEEVKPTEAEGAADYYEDM